MKKNMEKENRMIDEEELNKVSGGVAVDSNPNGIAAFNNVADRDTFNIAGDRDTFNIAGDQDILGNVADSLEGSLSIGNNLPSGLTNNNPTATINKPKNLTSQKKVGIKPSNTKNPL